MLSWPPAITISASPLRMACTACCTAFSPEPQTRLTVTAGVSTGSPARSAVCRAGFCPQPAVNTWPKISSSTALAGSCVRSSRPRTTAAPSSTAEREDKAPRKLPIGVRSAQTIATSFILPP